MKKFLFILTGLAALSFNYTVIADSTERSMIASFLFQISIGDIDDSTFGANYNYNFWDDSTASGSCDGYQEGHAGIDFQTKDVAGSATADRTFYSVSKGEVIAAGGGSYNTIAVYDSDHDLTVIYLHARSVSVALNATVKMGDALGIQGDTGISGSEHVHLEVRSGKQTSPACGSGTSVDPETYLVFLPGMTADGWNTDLSPPIFRAYDRNGGVDVLGESYEDGTSGTVYLHLWEGSDNVYVQNFGVDETDEYAILTHADLLSTSTANSASVIRHGFWREYWYYGGPSTFGVPVGDEMDETDTDLNGYDPYCDDDDDGSVSTAERESCVETCCESGDYESMQRFQKDTNLVVFCYESSTGKTKRKTDSSCRDTSLSIAIIESEAVGGGDEVIELDSDGDGLSDADEETYGTYNGITDSDHDGLDDGEEVHTYGTDPLLDDTDGDGLEDGTEVGIHTDPTNDDTDGDGLTDYYEIMNGLDSHDPDQDGDGITDGDDSDPHTAATVGTSEEYKIESPDGIAGDKFGYSVAIDEDVMVIGAYGNDEEITDGGAVYVYRLDDGTWTEEAKLLPGDLDTGNAFGKAVSISGDVIVVSAPSASTNEAVYVYRWDGSSWEQEAKLTETTSREYAASVSVSGDVVVVGDNSYYSGTVQTGTVFVYRYSGGSWSEEAQLLASDGAAGDDFGYSVSVDGDTIVVGAYAHDASIALTDSGQSYVYRYDGSSSWDEEAILTASDAAASDKFGISVSISGDSVLIGASGYSSSKGSAYVFSRSGTTWTQEGKLLADDGAGGSYFGQAVSIKGNLALVGAYKHDSSQGSAYLYNWNGESWAIDTQFEASDRASSDSFGRAVALSSENAVIGSYKDGYSGLLTVGSVYVYSGLATDTDGDGLTDSQELTLGTDSENEDTDSDGLSDFEEAESNNRTDPLSADTDSDGIEDDSDICPSTDSTESPSTTGCSSSERAEYKLVASDGASEDYFGYTVAADGDVAVVGAYWDDDSGSYSGSAYIYRWNGESWDEEAKLVAEDAGENHRFGSSVAIDGDTIVVGAYQANGYIGAVYVFERQTGGTWEQIQKLAPTDGMKYDYFGWSVAMSNDLIVVGSQHDDDGGSNSGSAYVFRYDGSSWAQEEKLIASDAAESDYFGYSVSVDEDTILVGAYNAENGEVSTGSAYVYYFDGSSWAQQTKLIPSDGESADEFGYSVSVTGERAVVGSPFHESQGAVYIYERDGTTWGLVETLTDPEGATSDGFGVSVSIDGQTLAVGSEGDDDLGGNSGSVSIFHSDGESWNREVKLTMYDGDVADNFGSVVALSPGENWVISGAYGDDPGGDYSGSATIFRDIVTDTDGDGFSDSEEESKGTNPNVSDSDDDGLSDYSDPYPLSTDNDADGFTTDDCDNTNSSIYPGATETCQDEIDQDCDGSDAICDADNDGVSDAEDLCPSTTLLGENDTVNDEGCALSERDTDSDTLTDYAETVGEKTAYLIPDGTYANQSLFGHAVAVNKDWLAVSSIYGTMWNAGSSLGLVTLYHWEGSEWIEWGTFTGSDTEVGDGFGFSLDLDGDVLVVGSLTDDDAISYSGSVYVFRWDGSNWNQEAKLVSDDPQEGAYLGTSLSLSGNTIVAGAYCDFQDGVMTGAAYVFEYDGTSWIQTNKIVPVGAQENDRIGYSVSVNGDALAIGGYNASEEGFEPGAVWIYRFDGTDWEEEQKLMIEEAGYTSFAFGYDVSLDGNRLLAEAGGEESTAYIFDYNSTWKQTAKLSFVETDLEGEKIGGDVALDGDIAVVGTAVSDHTYGARFAAATVYHWNGSEWTRLYKLDGGDHAYTYSNLMYVDVDEGLVLVGAWVENNLIGAAHVYDLSSYTNPKSSDTDGDGIADAVDPLPINPDNDADGYGADDCDNTDPSIHPGVFDICWDEIDQDCDGSDNECDFDGDGQPSLEDHGEDCDDSNDAIYFGADEICGDGIDQDCDGSDSSCNITYTVTKTADTNDGKCTSTDCSLREALVVSKADTTGAQVEIIFSISSSDSGCSSTTGFCTISPTKALPSLTRGKTTIDGGGKIVIDGTSAGSTTKGLIISNSSFNVIKNLGIQNFGSHGISITGSTASENEISGCYIGVDSSGVDQSNGGSGIYASSGADTIISGNAIAYNTLKGVHLNTTATIRNIITKNSLHDNVSTGIVLATSANNNKAKPVMTLAKISGTTVTITGTATSGDTIEVFISSADAEGQTYIGSTTADSTGNWSLTTSTTTAPKDTKVLATATDTTNGTSQFSGTKTVR